MDNENCIAITISGSAEQVEVFVSKVEQLNLSVHEKKFLKDFKIITLDVELTVFAYFAQWIHWSDEKQSFWDRLCQLAKDNHLYWSFQRLGLQLSDYEAYGSDDAYDYHELFSLRHEIEPYHPELIGKFELT